MAATSSGGNEISAMARYQIHAITGTTASLSIPTQEDMTVKGISGSWVSSDLKDRELGILYSQKKLGVRINDEIKYIQFESNSATGSLAATLAVGNETGTYNIITGTGTYIKSVNGGGRLDLDFFSTANEVLLSSDNASLGESYIYLQPDRVRINNNDISNGGSIDMSQYSLSLTKNSSGIHIKDNTATQSSPTVDNGPIFIGTNNSTSNMGITNSVIVGGEGIVATQSNTLYCHNLYVTGGFATATPLIKTSDDGTVYIGNTSGNGVINVFQDGVSIVGYGTGSAFGLPNILDTGNDPQGRVINGTWSFTNYQGANIFGYEGAMKPGGTQPNGVITPYSVFRQRAGTMSAPGQVVIESEAVDGNGAITMEGTIMVVNYDWSDKYTAKFYASMYGGGPATYSINYEIQNNASGTFSPTMSVFYANGGNLELLFSPGLVGTTWYFYDYKLTYLSIPV